MKNKILITCASVATIALVFFIVNSFASKECKTQVAKANSGCCASSKSKLSKTGGECGSKVAVKPESSDTKKNN